MVENKPRKPNRGSFKKGNIPHNQGVKGWQAGGKSVETQFKEGNVPPNVSPLGTERILKDMVQVKVAEGQGKKNWMNKNRYLYETYIGEVPRNHVIVFKDGDNRNFDLDNLECISRGELLKRNAR